MATYYSRILKKIVAKKAKHSIFFVSQAMLRETLNIVMFE